MSSIVHIDVQLWVACPECDMDIDLIDLDNGYEYVHNIFAENKCKGMTVHCPGCVHEFKLDGAIY